MLEVRATGDGLRVNASGSLQQLGYDLLEVCNDVIKAIAVENETEAQILRVWLAANISLSAGKEKGR